MDKLIYLASPYTSPFKEETERRVRQVQDATARLIGQGHLIFSPIVNSHPIAHLVPFDAGNYPGAMSPWMELDIAMIDRSDEVWVLCIPGWQESLGVEAEVQHALRTGKDIRFVNYPTLEITTAFSLFSTVAITLDTALAIYEDFEENERRELERQIAKANEAPRTTLYGAGSFYSPASNGLPPEPKFFVEETHTPYADKDQADTRPYELQVAERVIKRLFGENEALPEHFEICDDVTCTVCTQIHAEVLQDVHSCLGTPSCTICYPAMVVEALEGAGLTKTPAKQLIVGINGVAQSGKDTAGQYLVDSYGFVRIGLADILKEALYALNPMLELSGDLGSVCDLDTYVESAGGQFGYLELADVVDSQGWEGAKKIKNVRELLQRLGTEVGRNLFGQSFWLEQAKKKIDAAYPLPVVITDVRFDNEAEFVKSLGGHVAKVNRPGYESVNGHASEQPIEDAWIDYYLVNDGDKRDLYAQIEKFIDFLAEKTRDE